jgi:hypothetical protein
MLKRVSIMSDDDWYDDFVKSQSDAQFKPEERRELRARMVLGRVARLRRRRLVYWIKNFSLFIGVAIALANTPIGEIVRWLPRIFGKGGG